MPGPILLALGLMTGQDASSKTWTVPRTPDGQPDLSGTYDTATLTPLERPAQFGDKLFLTAEEAAAIEKEDYLSEELGRPAIRSEAPPVGGTGLPVPMKRGGYNFFWIDRGTEVFELDGRRQRRSRRSDGQLPPLTPGAKRAVAAELL
jgi:hypothetical protein